MIKIKYYISRCAIKSVSRMKKYMNDIKDITHINEKSQDQTKHKIKNDKNLIHESDDFLLFCKNLKNNFFGGNLNKICSLLLIFIIFYDPISYNPITDIIIAISIMFNIQIKYSFLFCVFIFILCIYIQNKY